MHDADKEEEEAAEGEGERFKTLKFPSAQEARRSGRLRRTSSTDHCFISIDTELCVTEKCGKMKRAERENGKRIRMS